ncbi:MAG: nucleoside hydrolase [Ignavibacteria bacterium RBG_16_34_14]|nr:MAG: nucleoside hydrolase [Ignavibacteria bacterium RBG_16_34_14]
MAVKILLDTDIGSDIDDAVCLAYLLANPECELFGITTVTSEPVKRAKLASVLCKIAGKDIPIYPGVENPLIIPQLQTSAKQAGALKRWEHKNNFPEGEAVEFLRSTIRKNPGEIILLTIGPLTNIGLLFSIDPEIPYLLKGLYSMSGNFLRKDKKLPKLEWNAMGDYHASAIVYNSKIKVHRSFGLDVTSKVIMKKNEFKEKFSHHNLFKPVLDFSKAWFEEWNGITFHDPLAAVAIFNKNVCGYEKGLVEIELEKKKERGLTKWKHVSNGKHEIAVTVNAGKFFENYFSVFK